MRNPVNILLVGTSVREKKNEKPIFIENNGHHVKRPFKCTLPVNGF